MPATTTLQSIACPTPEAASASLQGSILEFGRGGHEVNVRGIDIQELEDGTFMAFASLEVVEIEEEEDPETDKKSSTAEAEELIETENELFWLTHGNRGSLAEDSFPDVEGVDAVEVMESSEFTGYMGDRKAPDEPIPESDRIGIEQSSETLAETLETDFSEAMSPEPMPHGTVPDTAISTPLQAMSAEELREEEERLRSRQDELLAVIALKERQSDKDGPAPVPEE